MRYSTVTSPASSHCSIWAALEVSKLAQCTQLKSAYSTISEGSPSAGASAAGMVSGCWAAPCSGTSTVEASTSRAPAPSASVVAEVSSMPPCSLAAAGMGPAAAGSSPPRFRTKATIRPITRIAASTEPQITAVRRRPSFLRCCSWIWRARARASVAEVCEPDVFRAKGPPRGAGGPGPRERTRR